MPESKPTAVRTRLGRKSDGSTLTPTVNGRNDLVRTANVGIRLAPLADDKHSEAVTIRLGIRFYREAIDAESLLYACRARTGKTFEHQHVFTQSRVLAFQSADTRNQLFLRRPFNLQGAVCSIRLLTNASEFRFK